MEKAVVFGCGGTAEKYKDKIYGQFDVVAYTSNHPKSWGTMMDGFPVIPPAQIPEGTAIVVASNFYSEIIHGLDLAMYNRVYVLQRGEINKFSVGPNNDPDKLIFQYPRCKVLPTILQLGLSSLCNSKCRYCLYHSEYSEYRFHQGFMSEAVLNETLRQAKSIDSFRTLTLIGDGETLLHPRWQEFVARALNTYGAFEECVIYTNGMLLTEENATKLKRLPVPKLSVMVSIDGASPEECEYWRKGERFALIRENVNRAHDILGEAAKLTVTGCVVLPASINADSADEVEDYLKRSCEWRKKEFPFAEHTNGLAVPSVEHVPGTKIVHAAVFPKMCICINPFASIVVFSNGDIISCPCGYVFQNDEKYRIGNVMKDQLTDVFYHNKVFHDMRIALSNDRKPKICGECCQLGGDRILCLQKTE